MGSNMHIERVCKFCNSKFIAWATKTQYSSNSCSSKAYQHAARAEKMEIVKTEAKFMIKIKPKGNTPEVKGNNYLIY